MPGSIFHKAEFLSYSHQLNEVLKAMTNQILAPHKAIKMIKLQYTERWEKEKCLRPGTAWVSSAMM